MSAPEAQRRARIMVMLGSIEPERATLEALSLLAGRTAVEINGMFVEDIEVLALAELPIAREYCRLTHVERRLQTHDIERQFRVQARAAQQALAEIAARFGSPLSFQTVRGTLPTLLRAALEETDLMLFGAVRGALRIPGGTDRAFTARPSRRPVTVTFDGSDAARRALQVALQLAPDDVTPVIVILTAMRAADLPSLGEQVIRLAGARPVQRVGLIIPAWREVLEHVRAHRSGALVIAISAELLQEENLGQLRNELNCAIVLVK
jgi:hypothetical protein